MKKKYPYPWAVAFNGPEVHGNLFSKDAATVYNSIDEPPNSDINMEGIVKVILGLDSFHKPATWNNHGTDDFGTYAGTEEGTALPEAACDY